MRAFGCKEALKKLDDLKMTPDWPIPEPGPGEIRVRVYCASLNPVDWKIAVGEFPGFFPRIIGCDGSGTVDALGKDVTDFQVGDRVLFHNNVGQLYGTLSDFTICVACAVARIPAEMSFEDAAAVPCTSCTAYIGIVERLCVEPGKTILITGGAGGVGSAAVGISRLLGMRVIATASANNAQYVQALGADHVIDRRIPNEQLIEKIMEITAGVGCDYVFDAVGLTASPEGAKFVASALRFGGYACSTLPCADSSHFFFKGATLHFVFLGGYYSVKAMHPHFRELLDAITVLMVSGKDGKKLSSSIGKVYPLEEAVAAMKELAEGRHTKGKIVLRLCP